MTMNGHTNSSFGISIAELAGELDAREKSIHPGIAAPPLNPGLRCFTTGEIRQKYRKMIDRSRKQKRGSWYWDKRREPNAIKDRRVIRNAHSITLICKKNILRATGDGYWELRVKGYGETYYLCTSERFYHQPVAAGAMSTGVLVAADVVATAAHFVTESRVKNRVFIFDFVMDAKGKPIIRFPNEKVYRGVEVLYRKYDVDSPNASGADIALVRLDRKVEGRETAVISNEPVQEGRELYGLGHPCGLPLKYAPGGIVKHIKPAFFETELDMYSGNSGSGVFCRKTHELLGIVCGADPRDFHWVNDCCVSVVYPNKEINSNGTRCIKVTEFNEYLSRR